MKEELQKLVENSFRELISFRFETFFIVFLFLFLSVFQPFHLLLLFSSLLVIFFHVYEIYKSNREKKEVKEDEIEKNSF